MRDDDNVKARGEMAMGSQIVKNLKEGKKQAENGKYLGLSIALLSIGYGAFIFYYQGYFMQMVNRYIDVNIEKGIGGFLFVVGVMKLVAVIIGNRTLKKISIILLLFVWGGLLTVGYVYSIGDGYPSPIPLFFAKIVLDCYRVVIKGDVK